MMAQYFISFIRKWHLGLWSRNHPCCQHPSKFSVSFTINAVNGMAHPYLAARLSMCCVMFISCSHATLRCLAVWLPCPFVSTCHALSECSDSCVWTQKCLVIPGLSVKSSSGSFSLQSSSQSLVKIANSKHRVWYQRFMQRSKIEESLCLVSVSQLYWDWVYPLNFAKLLMASISSSFDIKI